MLWIVLSIFFISSPTFAKNGDFTSFANQLAAGQHCNDVVPGDIRNAGYKCRPLSATNREESNPTLIFESLVFDEASANQVLKNNCVMEKTKTLMGQGRWRDTWTKILIHNWLLAKKTDEILKFCRTRYWDRLANTDENLPPGEAFDKFMNREIQTWPSRKEKILEDAKLFKNKCLDTKLMIVAAQGKDILTETMPGVSSPEFFKILDEKQKHIINRRTNKPLTNSDIMRTDLADLSFLNFDHASPLFEALDQKNLGIYTQRAEMNGRIDAAQKSGEMSQELKDEIYEDDTVKELLREKKLVPSDPKAKTMNPAVSCLLSRYEPNLIADTAELIGTSIVTGGVIGVAVNSTKAMKVYRLLKAAGKHKMLVGTGIVSGGRLMNRCLSQSVQLRKTKDHIESEGARHMDGHAGLTRQNAVPYKKWNISFDEKETPSCHHARIKNQLVENESQLECLAEQFTNLLPMVVGLPVLQSIEK